MAARIDSSLKARRAFTLHLGAVGKDDDLKGRFTAETSAIVFDLYSNDEIVIDVEKPEG